MAASMAMLSSDIAAGQAMLSQITADVNTVRGLLACHCDMQRLTLQKTDVCRRERLAGVHHAGANATLYTRSGWRGWRAQGAAA
jgi:hypothetical protein